MPANEPSTPPTIAVVGVSGVDITVRDPPDWMGSTKCDAYTPESLHTLAAPVRMGLGGNGAAAAYVLGTLGLPVELYTAVGNDTPGQMVRGWLTRADLPGDNP